MGDMKTPDFDDLLAAFDIPDATGLDAKEPIQGSHEETENQLKHTGICLDDSLLGNQSVTASDVPVVSVIVKNTSRQESLEGFSDRLHSEPALQNGFGGQEAGDPVESGFPKSFESVLNGGSSRELPGEAPAQHKPDGTPVFSLPHSPFSPVSSSDSEETLCSRGEMLSKQERPSFPTAPVLVEPSVPENQNQMDLSMFDNCHKNTEGTKDRPNICVSNTIERTSKDSNSCPSSNGNQPLVETNCNSRNKVDASASYSPVTCQTSKLSPCLEALVALNSGNDPSEQSIPRECLSVPNDCLKASPKVPMSPRSPRSPLETVKRLSKPCDSPVSICSDSSGQASPAVMSGSPPAIPRVRIKTIKTMSGQIKRTVTSVLPDSETDELHSAYESSPSQSMISEDSYCNVSPHQSHPGDYVVGIHTKINSARNRSSAKVLPRKSKVNSEEKRKSKTVFHNTARHVKRSSARQGQNPKRAALRAGLTTNTTFLPKAVHLASLNLVPHSVAASVNARSGSHQQSRHTLSPAVCSTVPLVHQVKPSSTSARPSVPNTAAGSLNRLLNNANPVPVYVPNLSPPPESNISLPPRGYCCLECGDSFGVERSLAYHYNRRSVHIEVDCTHCAKSLVFFNRCALLAHAREHKHSGMVMQCTQLHMKPISEENMFPPMSTDPVDESSHGSPVLARKSEPVLPLYPDNVIRYRLFCVECNKKVADHKALAGHYQKLSEDVEGLICKVCSMLLPNKCSFRAHQRIHSHKSPFCCPECGALCRSADVQKHVRENCLHYARKAWYKCLHCDMVFKTLQGQKSHIEEKHCEVFYKCSVCPVAFKTCDSCEAHLKNKHSAAKQPPQLVFKCSCESFFKKKQLFFQHFQHNANKRVTCVFKCPECNSVFPQKRLLMQHFKAVHTGNIAAETESNTKDKDKADRHRDSRSTQKQEGPNHRKNTESPRKKSEQTSRPRVKPSGWTCGECLQCFSERESYTSHLKVNHGKSVRKYPCRHCEQSFNSATSLRRHIRTDHDGKRRIYTCWYCTNTKTTFTTSVMLKNHISLMHGIKNPDLSLMPKASLQEYKHSSGKGLVPAPAAGGGQAACQDPAGLEAPSAKRLKTQFRCSKCGFITANSTEFQQHIPQHKSNENTPQCLHCGLCFTSVLSLNRHLFIVHKVKDPERVAKAEGDPEKADVVGQDPDERQGRSEEADERQNEASPHVSESPHCTKATDCHLNTTQVSVPL
ncbi:unnamed protein product [Menidia menidia]|uniref:(Atlantic silverside) hypothetical protein n=1 Tax=Menidia menidia TaxID=238744 RepID=A0A8S4BLG4_9TELE|nr:unnamed protein product [Menidia menidia]